MENKPEVTVGVLCYNHEEYIAQCLDSIFEQKCDFSYKVFVFDDVSIDNSWQIIQAYKEKYGEKMIIKQPEKNSFQARIPNAFMQELKKNTDTKYIALCEADDYWTDEKKLQKQYDLMEKNPQASICVHDVQMDDITGKTDMGIVPGRIDKKWTKEEWIIRVLTYRLSIRLNSYFLCSAVIGKEELGGALWDYWAPDLVILVYYLLYGECLYIPENMATKRVNNSGSYSRKSNLEKDVCEQQIGIFESDIRWIKELEKICNQEYIYLIRYYIAYREIKLYYLRRGELELNKLVSNANGKVFTKEVWRKINRLYVKIIRFIYGDKEYDFVRVTSKWMEKEWNRLQRKERKIF